MPPIPREQLDHLCRAVATHDGLRPIVAEIERLHRVVFHDNARADWSLVGRSAEQVLIAEIVNRYGGDVERLIQAVRALERSGKGWDGAVREMAAAVHSYYTTPLGIVMRQELFGADAIFITPDALTWTAQFRRPADGPGGQQS